MLPLCNHNTQPTPTNFTVLTLRELFRSRKAPAHVLPSRSSLSFNSTLIVLICTYSACLHNCSSEEHTCQPRSWRHVLFVSYLYTSLD